MSNLHQATLVEVEAEQGVTSPTSVSNALGRSPHAEGMREGDTPSTPAEGSSDSEGSGLIARRFPPDHFDTFLADRTLRRASIVAEDTESARPPPLVQRYPNHELTYVTSTAASIFAPPGASIAVIESVLDEAFSGDIPQEPQSRISVHLSNRIENLNGERIADVRGSNGPTLRSAEPATRIWTPAPEADWRDLEAANAQEWEGLESDVLRRPTGANEVTAYTEPTLGTVWAPAWATLADIEGAIEDGFQGELPANPEAQIYLDWPDRTVREFEIRWLAPGEIHRVQIEDRPEYEDADLVIELLSSTYTGSGAASDSAIAALEDRQVTADDEQPKCAICQDEKDVGDTITELPCACVTVYDRECIEQWLRSNQTCPSCRRSIPTARLRGDDDASNSQGSTEGNDQGTHASDASMEHQVETPQETFAEIVQRAIQAIEAPFQTLEHTRTPRGTYNLRPSRN